ncbi:MAG: hypothetical protein LBI34_02795 [Puniceicoccales bacterium]|nr:hypothetical protein [Puniceicoccales bacterium]
MHTLGGAHIRIGDEPTSMHLANNAVRDRSGTHWNAYRPMYESKREKLTAIFRAQLMPE